MYGRGTALGTVSITASLVVTKIVDNSYTITSTRVSSLLGRLERLGELMRGVATRTSAPPIYTLAVYVQCNQAREQNFISEFEPILTHKIESIIDKSLKFGTNLLQHKLYIEFKLWDVTMITSIFMAS